MKVKWSDVYIADFKGLDCGLYGYVPAISVQSSRVNPELSITIVVTIFTLAEESTFCVPLKEKNAASTPKRCVKELCVSTKTD